MRRSDREMRIPDQQLLEWKNTTAVVVDVETARRAERQIASCEGWAPDEAEVPFDYLLDSITGCDPECTDYVLAEPAQCPACGASLQTGSWQWSDSEEEGRTAFIL